MSTIKCPNCNLINFATAQFCKRCNFSMKEASTVRNDTNISIPAGGTSVRQIPQKPRPNPQPLPPTVIGYDPQKSYQQQQNGQFHQNNYAPPQNNYAPPQSYDYDLPQFPQGQRPPQFNQYQTPQYQHPQYIQLQEVAYRKLGTEIALHKNGNLPEICVKCGEDLTAYNGGAFVVQSYRWHHPALYLLLLSPIIYLIVSLCVSERATINVPLCHEHIKSRENARNILICGGVISTFLVILSINFGWVGFGFLIFFAALFGLTGIFEYAYKPVRIKRAQGSYFHLAGASDNFLNRLPF